MKTITKTIYLQAVCREGEGIVFHIMDSAMNFTPEYTVVDSCEVTFDVPDIDTVTPAVIKSLEAKRDAMRAAASAAITEVDNQIASLLALENQSEA